MINKKFRIDIFDDLENEDLTADIYFEDQILAIVSQESGFNNMKIEIYPSKDRECWNFRFDEFEAAINQAKKRLWELRKTSEDS